MSIISTAKLSSKGLLVIPKDVREKLSLKRGVVVVFYLKKGEIYIRKG